MIYRRTFHLLVQSSPKKKTWTRVSDIAVNPVMANPTDSSQGVSGTQLRSELAQIAIETIAYGAHTVSFQPRTQYPIEDRHLVEDWKLSNGTWKFIGIFDGSCLRLV
jgi:hypothetical protein